MKIFGVRLSSVQYLVKEGFRNVWVNRLMSIASIGVLISCLLLIGAAVLFSVNVNNALGVIEKQNVIMVFLNDNVDAYSRQLIENELNENDNITDVTLVDKEQALRNLLDSKGQLSEEYFEELNQDNPLPDAFRVSIKNLKIFDETLDEIIDISGVDSIKEHRDITNFLIKLRQTVTVAGIGLIGMLLVISLFIISNTIKITMYVRKLEINIMKAVGATNWFVRIPFIIEGMALGIIAGIATLGILYYSYKGVLSAFDITLADFRPIAFGSIAWQMLAGFLVIGLAAGTFGSLISISKYLKKEGSEFSAL